MHIGWQWSSRFFGFCYIFSASFFFVCGRAGGTCVSVRYTLPFPRLFAYAFISARWIVSVLRSHCALDTPTKETIVAYRRYLLFFFYTASRLFNSVLAFGRDKYSHSDSVCIYDFHLFKHFFRAIVDLALVNFSKPNENTHNCRIARFFGCPSASPWSVCWYATSLLFQRLQFAFSFVCYFHTKQSMNSVNVRRLQKYNFRKLPGSIAAQSTIIRWIYFGRKLTLRVTSAIFPAIN